jgi:hypothetical protein
VCCILPQALQTNQDTRRYHNHRVVPGKKEGRTISYSQVRHATANDNSPDGLKGYEIHLKIIRQLLTSPSSMSLVAYELCQSQPAPDPYPVFGVSDCVC